MPTTINAKLLAMNLIRHIGDEVSKNGKSIDIEVNDVFSELMGSPSKAFIGEIACELQTKGQIRCVELNEHFIRSGDFTILTANLSLDGWELYENEKRGKLDGNYGFIAMKFEDAILDELMDNNAKPEIKKETRFRCY